MALSPVSPCPPEDRIGGSGVRPFRQSRPKINPRTETAAPMLRGVNHPGNVGRSKRQWEVR